MKNLIRTILVAGMGLVLSACAGMQLQKAQDAKAGGDTFDKALYAGYLGLSQSEYSEGDYRDSDDFAGRAMAAARGEKFRAEPVAMRNLPASKVGELTSARKWLNDAFNQGAANRKPKSAAEAQVKFDCWMQEQEENFQPADIAACRKAFLVAMGKLAEEKPMRMKQAMAPKPAIAQPQIDGIYILFFDYNSDQLNPAGKEVVRKAIFDYHLSKSGGVELSGHADTSGSNAYNQALSARRLATVRATLENGNVPAGRISLEAFGENKPLVQTGDGEKELRNRRVEIILE